METHTLIQYCVIGVVSLIFCFAFLGHGQKQDRKSGQKRHKQRMQRAIDSTPAVPTTAAPQPSSSSHSEPNARGPPSLEQLQSALKSFKKVYPKYGPRFAPWWEQQGQAERLEFLLSWSPFMPLAWDKPYMYENGVRVEVHGALLLIPDWNQQDLLQGDRLPQLLRDVAEVQGTEGRSDFYELCCRELPAAATLALVRKSQLPPEAVAAGLSFIAGSEFGKTFVVKKAHPNVQWMQEHGFAVPAVVCEALQWRLKILLGNVTLCLDTYRVDVEQQGQGQYKAVGSQLGCAECGALETQEGGLLAPCTACQITFYCSKACQKAHWPVHKPDCKPKELWKAGVVTAAKQRVFLP